MSNGRPDFLARLGVSGPYLRKRMSEQVKPSGIWRLLPFEPQLLRAYRDWSDSDIIKMVNERIQNFSSDRDRQRGLLYAMGDLAKTIDPQDNYYRHNKIMQGYIDRILQAGMIESAVDIGVRRVIIGTSYNPNVAQTQLGNERLRYGFTSSFTEGLDRNVFITFVERSQGELFTGTVIADGGNTTTVCKLSGGSSNFTEGDRVRAKQPTGYTWTEIEDVDTVDHVLTFTSELRSTAAAGDTIELPWSELGLVCGNLASDTPNTGLLLNRVDRQDFPRGNKMVAIEAQTIYSKATS
jgi:hypothetical protein